MLQQTNQQSQTAINTSNHVSPHNAHRARFHVVTCLFTSPQGQRWDKQKKIEDGLWLVDTGLTATVYIASLLHGKLLNWEELLTPRLLERQHEQGLDFIPLPNPKKAQECPAYLTYIIENYHQLPHYMVFLHGKPLDHNPVVLIQLRDLVQSGVALPGFLHLNSFVRSTMLRCISAKQIGNLIPLVKLLQHRERPDCFQPKYCCGQFIVSREAVLNRTLHFYHMLRKLAIDNQDCSVLEHIWHVIFGHSPEYDGLSITDLLHPSMRSLMQLRST